MGIVFGITGTEEPPYSVLKTASSYEIRAYEPFLIAEVPTMEGDEKGNSAFKILAKYIGVFGEAENEGVKPMAMTAPVISEPSQGRGTKMAMTAPVISEPQKMAMTAPVLSEPMGGQTMTMSFVLPFEFKTLDSLPKPKNSLIKLRQIPKRFIAVTTFSGWYADAVGMRYLKQLSDSLVADQIVQTAIERDSPQWSVAQYHPPFTLPFMRRNEIWVELDAKNARIKELLEEQEKKSKQTVST